MRTWGLLFAVLAFTPSYRAGCQTSAPASRPSTVAMAEAPAHAWVRLLNAGKWDSLATLTTQDFLIVKGTEQSTVDDLVRGARDEGLQSITATIDRRRTWVVGDIAYSQYRGHARFRVNDVEGSMEEIGTQVMRRENGQWKLSFWHLTQISPPSR